MVEWLNRESLHPDFRFNDSTSHASTSGLKRLQFQFARRGFFELLDFHFRLGEFFLADFHQLRAFLVFGEQGFQRQIVRLHGLDDALKFFEGFFKRHAALGRVPALAGFDMREK